MMLDGFCSDRVCRSFSAAEFCWSHWQMCSRSLQLHNCRQGLVRWEENSRTVSIVSKTKTNGSGVRVQLKPVQIKSLLDWLTSAAVLFFLSDRWLWWCMCMCVCVCMCETERESPRRRWGHQPSYIDGPFIILRVHTEFEFTTNV